VIGGANPVAGGGPVVLGLDTATAATAVALRLDDGRTTQLRDDPSPGEHPGHATRLLAMAHELLTSSGVAWSDVQRIAVGTGPGTFTGLRVGIATARSLAQSLATELVGVSSLEALAAAALAPNAQPPDAPAADTVLAVIDARRGEVFAAAYELAAERPRELTAPAAVAPERLGELLAQVPARQGARRWLAVGDGAVRYREHLRLAAVASPLESSPLQRVSAGAICELGSRAAPARSWEDIVPDYRRRPDAELALDAVETASASRT
jgi:tRNA threonylcarbamoyladenosine biosynthesis protein TsaB